MAIKPTDTFIWATDATFGSGPANGQPTKLPPGTPAQGFVPGNAIVAEWSNTLENITGQWTGWLFAGSFDRSDVSAHIVETDVDGIAGVYKLQAGDNTLTSTAIQAISNGNVGSTITSLNDGGVAGSFFSTTTSAIEATTFSNDPADGGFRAIVSGAGGSGYVSEITTDGSRGANISVDADNAVGVFVDVIGGANSAGVSSRTAATGAAVSGLSTATGLGGLFQNSGTGGALEAQSLSGDAFVAVSATGDSAVFTSNPTRGAFRITGSAGLAFPAADGCFDYVTTFEHPAVWIDSTTYGTVVPYLIHKSRNGNFFGVTTAATQITGTFDPEVIVLNYTASYDRMPKTAAQDALVEALVTIRLDDPVSGNPPTIRVLVRDADTLAPVVSEQGFILDTQGQKITISIAGVYTIPVPGPRSFQLEVTNLELGGEQLTVTGRKILVRDLGV